MADPGTEQQDQPRFSLWMSRMLRRRNLSANAFSKEFGISQSAVSKWTQGESVPSRETCERIAAFFGVPLNEVLIQAGHIPREIRLGPSAKHTHLHDLIDDLPEGMIDPLISMVEAIIRETR